MGFTETVALGAIAGLTIFIGLPLGRVRALGDRARVCLAMFSVGILAFIFMDVTKHGEQILETGLVHLKAHSTGLGHVLVLFALLAAGFTAGTAGISAIERRLRSRRTSAPPIAGGEATAVLSSEQVAHAQRAEEVRRRALETGMVIAIAIGLHNFAEGLAIGVSAKAGAIGLATVLIIGFGLHNATEGFGIVGPLGGARPSWRWLGIVGLIGGGPTFLGTMVGYQVHSSPLELMFYALAGGAILYVIGEIWSGMRRYGHHTLGLYMMASGFLAGVATDLIVSYGGG
ncbi:MAG: zinc transporter, family [Solirubrobacteraceae bacterium]|jgi:ZIP family zinc transporter|nr:zinc transporter, family [Solirubrobacteraceae bacterium]